MRTDPLRAERRTIAYAAKEAPGPKSPRRSGWTNLDRLVWPSRDCSYAVAKRASRALPTGRLVFVPSERERDLCSDARSVRKAVARKCRGQPMLLSTSRRARHRQRGRACERLEDDTVALGQTQQGGQLVLVRLGLQREVQPDRREADGSLLINRQGSAKVEVSLGVDGAAEAALPRRACGRPRYAQGRRIVG